MLADLPRRVPQDNPVRHKLRDQQQLQVPAGSSDRQGYDIEAGKSNISRPGIQRDITELVNPTFPTKK